MTAKQSSETRRELLELDKMDLTKMSKIQIIGAFCELRDAYVLETEEKTNRINALSQEVVALRQEKEDEKSRKINLEVHQPSSKKPEWDKDGNPKNPGQKKGRTKKRKKMPGSGNEDKSNVQPEETNYTPLNQCPGCGNDLSQQEGAAMPPRIVEDIVPPQEKTLISAEIEETKWCSGCRKMVFSKTRKALPGSDIGLNAVIEMSYLWVMCALSLPNIQAFFRCFKTLKISTAGISKIMIRLSFLLQPVYDEILDDVKHGVRIWADETGWRVKGKLWWLWIFANERSAYYWADRCRGAPVVEKILGPFFLGVLTVDAWHAYTKIVCVMQTCMAHIFRKIRAFIEAYPDYRTLMLFYLQLRKIIRTGEILQKNRQQMGEPAFQRQLKALKGKLEQLLNWSHPNPVLKDVIKKVRRQQKHILTFVEHEGVTHHNNYGEYIIKKGVLKRKVSGGSMSEEGARAYACLQSIAMTCHLRNISFHQFLRASLVQLIQTGRPLLLAEFSARITQNQAMKMAA